MTGDEKMMKATRVYFESAKGIRLRDALVSWEALAELSSVQTIQEHVVSCLRSLHKEYLVHNKAEHMVYTMRSEICGSRLENLDIYEMLLQ